MYGLEKTENLQVLILEDFGGQSLKQWLTDLGFGIWDSRIDKQRQSKSDHSNQRIF